MAKHGVVNMGSVIKDITLNIELVGVKSASLRIHVALYLIRFAAWVGGFGGVEFEESKDND